MLLAFKMIVPLANIALQVLLVKALVKQELFVISLIKTESKFVLLALIARVEVLLHPRLPATTMFNKR